MPSSEKSSPHPTKRTEEHKTPPGLKPTERCHSLPPAPWGDDNNEKHEIPSEPLLGLEFGDCRPPDGLPLRA